MGTIFTKSTGKSIGRAFEEWIARPLNMRGFLARDVHLGYESCSIHPAYPFYISAHNLARFGQLYLEQGQWQGRKIIPAQWIRESTSAYTWGGEVGYGYLWWTYKDLAFFANGFGGQFVVVVPSRELVIVNRVDTGRPGPERRQWLKSGQKVTRKEMKEILEACSGGPSLGWSPATKPLTGSPSCR